MAIRSAEEIRQAIDERATQELQEKIYSVHAKYKDFFDHQERTQYLLERNLQRQELKIAEKEELLLQQEALLLQKTLLEEYLLCHAREALAENQQLMAENEGLVAQKQQLMAENEGLVAQKQQLMAENEGLVAEMQQLMAQSDTVLGRSSNFVSVIGAVAAGVLVGVFFKQRSV